MSTESQEEQFPSVPSEPFQDLPWPFGSLAWRYRCPGTNASRPGYTIQRATCSPAIKASKLTVVTLKLNVCNKFMPLANTSVVFKCDYQPKIVSTRKLVLSLVRHSCHSGEPSIKMPAVSAKCWVRPGFKANAIMRPRMVLPRIACRTYATLQWAPGSKTCGTQVAVDTPDIIKAIRPLASIFFYKTEIAKLFGRLGQTSRCGNVLSVDSNLFKRNVSRQSFVCSVTQVRQLGSVQAICRSVIAVDNVAKTFGTTRPSFTCRLYPTGMTIGSKLCGNIHLGDAPLLVFGRVFGGVSYRTAPITSGRVVGNWLRK